MAMPGTALPAAIWPVRMRPRNGSDSISTDSIWNGSSLRDCAAGDGTCSTIRSNKGARVSDGVFMSIVAQPFLPEA